jgi:hypothetical protein
MIALSPIIGLEWDTVKVLDEGAGRMDAKGDSYGIGVWVSE